MDAIVGGVFRIPFNRPTQTGKEADQLARILVTGKTGGPGEMAKACAQKLERITSCPRTLITPSCTLALELSLKLLGLKPGDEVIVPDFTYPTTASTVAALGAIPVFADSSPENPNLDPNSVLKLLSPKTKAVIVTHYAGIPCDLRAIEAICRDRKIPFIEDAAQGLGSRLNDRHLGTFGSLGAVSFHETKNIQCGQGGAILVNDPKLWDRAQCLSDRGTNRRQFEKGFVKQYEWVDLGSAYLASEISCAYLLPQLEMENTITRTRLSAWNHYQSLFQGLSQQGKVSLPKVPATAAINGHIFYLLLKSKAARDGLLSHLTSNGIQATTHYVPLHSTVAGQAFGKSQPAPMQSQSIADRILRLPIWYGISKSQQEEVFEFIQRELGKFREKPQVALLDA